MHHVLWILQLKEIKSSTGNLGSATNNMSCCLMGSGAAIKGECADSFMKALTCDFRNSWNVAAFKGDQNQKRTVSSTLNTEEQNDFCHIWKLKWHVMSRNLRNYRITIAFAVALKKVSVDDPLPMASSAGCWLAGGAQVSRCVTSGVFFHCRRSSALKWTNSLWMLRVIPGQVPLAWTCLMSVRLFKCTWGSTHVPHFMTCKM